MSDKYHAIVGVPGAGKTTYLAALWHLLNAGDAATEMNLDHLDGNLVYLNEIAEKWRKGTPMDHTSGQAEAPIALYLSDPSGSKHVLAFDDLSGETFNQQIELRLCTDAYIEGYKKNGGILLFANANHNQDAVDIAELNAAIPPDEVAAGQAGQAAKAGTVDAQALPQNADNSVSADITEEEPEWTIDETPRQVRMVELLQFLLQAPFPPKHRRVAIIVSAWDTVHSADTAPREWLALNCPILHQFLTANPASFEYRVYGVSALGGDIEDPVKRTELLGQSSTHRIQCVGEDVQAHNLTAPIAWLNQDG